MTDELERRWLCFANSVWLTLLLTFTSVKHVMSKRHRGLDTSGNSIV
jgi:hypothetical protein